jgi:zinc protease
MKNQEKQIFSQWAQKASEKLGFPVQLTGAHRHNPFLYALRYSLPNGLKIVLMPDARAPVFTYQSWFKVGSKDEDPQHTGAAHLCEHLMFKATHTYPNGTFDREMERRGCQTNAATWVDWTFYTQSLAAREDHLETTIRFEADRMTQLILDNTTFEHELEVVKNERRLEVDDSVSGTLHEKLYALAFDTHPYQWPTIGFMKHLEHMRLIDLQNFYQRFYTPNNATIVIVGDIDVLSTLSLLGHYYGKLLPREVKRRNYAEEPVQVQCKTQEFQRPISSCQIAIGFHAPSQDKRDAVALDMLNDALVLGESGRLYQRLVLDLEIATDVEASVAPFAEPGLYDLFISLRSGVDAQRVVDVVQEELHCLGNTGLSDAEFSKVRHHTELAFWESFNDTENAAEALGHYETNFGDFSMAFRALSDVEAIDQEHLKKVARDVFCSSKRSVVIVRPTDSQSTAP